MNVFDFCHEWIIAQFESQGDASSDADAGGSVASGGRAEVAIDCIDTIVGENGDGRKVGIIKMDIEGYEKIALEGAEGVIKNDRPILIIAPYHSGRDFFEIPRYIKSLNSDYTLTFVNSNPLTPIFEEYLIAY